MVKNHVAPSTATKRHGSDIKVIYHAEQLADKWENILPLKLDPIVYEKADQFEALAVSQNSESLIAETSGQTYELQKSPITFDSDNAETPKNDEPFLEDIIHKSATDLVENVLTEINDEVVQQREEALRKSTELLVEYILIESLEQESEPQPYNNIESLEQESEPRLSEQNNNIIDDTETEADSEKNKNQILLQEKDIYSPSSINLKVVHEQDLDISSPHTNENQAQDDESAIVVQQTESDINSSKFDINSVQNIQQEQYARKIMERVLKMVNIADKKNDEDLEEETNHRKMISGSWMVGRNVSRNNSEVKS